MTSVPRALGIAAALTLVAALFGLGSASAAQAPADPHAGAPKVGACYDLTLKQSYDSATSESPVRCGRRHTMVVTAVGKAPASVDWATIDWTKPFPKALSTALTRTCEPAATKLLGPARLRARTLYKEFFYAPSDKDVAAGARWFTCLVGLQESTRLVPMSGARPKKLTAKIPNKVARCAKTARSGYPTVACSRPHQWRTTYAKSVRGKLTDKSALAAAKRVCPSHVSSRVWLYHTEWVSPKSFVVGCSTKTRR